MATESVTSAALMMAGMFKYDRAACGGPMHTVSSASRTCLVLKSAVECTATVLIPSSRQARRMRSAISPRLAMTTFSIMSDRPRWLRLARGEICRGRGHEKYACGLPLFDDEQRLAELDGLPVLGEYRGDASRLVRFDLVHHLHGLDDAKNLADLDFGAEFHEGLCARRGRRVIRADHRRGHRIAVGARLVLARRGSGGRRRGRQSRGHG